MAWHCEVAKGAKQSLALQQGFERFQYSSFKI